MVISDKDSALTNLLAAYEGELNSHAKYKAFAERAEAEGLRRAATLFRAAGRAEQIHAGNHAKVIRRMGGEMRVQIYPVRARTTLENLKSALYGERNEIDTLYPQFLAHASARFDMVAARSFGWAMESEKSHAILFAEAVKAFESGRIIQWTEADVEYFVCIVCGYTAKTREADNCPVCNFQWDRFEGIR
jgi:rubrerythrin